MVFPTFFKSEFSKFVLGVQNEAGQRLIEFRQENTLIIANTREDSTHGHHQMVNTKVRLSIFFAAKDGEALYSQQKQDWKLTVTQIMSSLLKNSDLRKVGKTTGPFRYELNQIPYDCTVEVTNRFKGLDLIDRVPEELWMEVRDIVQEIGIKTIPKKKKCKKAKWLSKEALQIAVKRSERQRRKGNIYHLNQSSKGEQGEIRTSSLVINAKK